MNPSPHYSGFDKQMDVVNLYELAGHSPACFWIGGYESNPISNVNIYKKKWWYNCKSSLEKWFTIRSELFFWPLCIRKFKLFLQQAFSLGALFSVQIALFAWFTKIRWSRNESYWLNIVKMFSWNVSGNPMEQYFTEWESGYPKNRCPASPPLLLWEISSKRTLPAFYRFFCLFGSVFVHRTCELWVLQCSR